ncbi:3-oxoacyl-ACP synthase [Croceiramulus getboli]|nr:3-oxoacyl-ACP synthase [Flavobacteriaceae bacterium YJPT1-3]
MKKTELKQGLFDHCTAAIARRRAKIETVIQDIEESLAEETKGTAGDKHETGRAMLHIDREQAGTQLMEIERIEAVLKKIDLKQKSDYARLGSLVYTSMGTYFLSTSVGEIKWGGKSYYAIAMDAPLGKLLLGKKGGDTIPFRDQQVKITSIY